MPSLGQKFTVSRKKAELYISHVTPQNLADETRVDFHEYFFFSKICLEGHKMGKKKGKKDKKVSGAEKTALKTEKKADKKAKKELQRKGEVRKHQIQLSVHFQ